MRQVSPLSLVLWATVVQGQNQVQEAKAMDSRMDPYCLDELRHHFSGDGQLKWSGVSDEGRLGYSVDVRPSDDASSIDLSVCQAQSDWGAGLPSWDGHIKTRFVVTNATLTNSGCVYAMKGDLPVAPVLHAIGAETDSDECYAWQQPSEVYLSNGTLYGKLIAECTSGAEETFILEARQTNATAPNSCDFRVGTELVVPMLLGAGALLFSGGVVAVARSACKDNQSKARCCLNAKCKRPTAETFPLAGVEYDDYRGCDPFDDSSNTSDHDSYTSAPDNDDATTAHGM